MIGCQKVEQVTTYVTEIRLAVVDVDAGKKKKTGLSLQRQIGCERSLTVSCHESGEAILTQLILVTFETLWQIIK